MARPDPHVVALHLVGEQFPHALVAILAGSAGAGRTTDTSDLDLVVVLGGPPAPYRETLRFGGWLVEVFVHTTESLEHFYELERAQGRCTLAHMVATGDVITDTGIGAVLRPAAQGVLDAGPQPLSEVELDRRRYMLTADVDDLADAIDADERDTIASHVAAQAADLYLRANRQWSGYGKWGHRQLMITSPGLATRLAAGRRAVSTDGDVSQLVAAVEEVLGGVGGPLDVGYRVPSDNATEDGGGPALRVQRFAAYGVTRQAESVLLVRISSTARGDAEVWTLPGGGVDHGESPEQAVVREFAEETGYDIVVERLLEVGSDHRTLRDGPDYHGVFAVCEVSIVGGTAHNEVGGSTDQVQWIHLSDLDDLNMLDASRAVLDRWLDPDAAAP
jgi:ADP-ribose pyrophosphatase YjhB (NUDIX family)